MSGGRLVVLDRAGRRVKSYPLPEGLATLGSDSACDIRVMLPTISLHHATIVVHAYQTVVRNVSDGETLVNGQPISVAALQHGDLISLGGRSLRWEYDDPTVKRPGQAEPVLHRGRIPRGVGAGGAGGAAAREPHVQRALELASRASMPAGGGKQVAVVQPQRRDNIQNDSSGRLVVKPHRPFPQSSKRQRTSKGSESAEPHERSKRASSSALTTKASEWIESRRSAPRAVTGRAALTPAGGRRVQSAVKMRVAKIEEPVTIDHTKQAAIMLMAGHTPKSRISAGPPTSAKKSASFLVKKTPTSGRGSGSGKKAGKKSKSPKNDVKSDENTRRSSKRGSQSVIFELSDSSVRAPSDGTSHTSMSLLSPKKSAMKDPNTKRSSRKNESIKFDLSNLEHYQDDTNDVVVLSDTKKTSYTLSDTDITLHYSDTSHSPSPSPRRSGGSRSARMLESLGSLLPEPPGAAGSRGPAASSPVTRYSRGSLIVQKALDNSAESSRYSKRTTKSPSDSSRTTIASAYKTGTLSPRSAQQLETYSIVELLDSSGSARRSASLYGSLGSTRSSSFMFGSPMNAARHTRSTLEPNLLGSSTPYIAKTASRTSDSAKRRKSSPVQNADNSVNISRRSKSLTTPVTTPETKKLISVNSTRISRSSKSKSRLNESDLLAMSQRDESSPTSSRTRSGHVLASPILHTTVNSNRSTMSRTTTIISEDGTITPENQTSPKDNGTPMLNMQSLLDASLNSSFANRRSRVSASLRRKTIGARSGLASRRSQGARSKSLNINTRNPDERSTGSDGTDEEAPPTANDEENITPKSTVKLQQEAVKNKHSSAKKPKSKRSIIDNLNDSDIVKQLFNSPVKRKLSQSMAEFSRKHLFDDEDEVVVRPTRHTIAVAGLGSPQLGRSEQPASSLTTPTNSPNGAKSLYRKTTPENHIRNAKVKARTRKSVKNDLTNVDGVKRVFAKSPDNRLSDVRVKELFVRSPRNDLRRVTGVKSLFRPPTTRRSPANDLSDVAGVKLLFQKNSPRNDLRNISGVKRTMRKSANNDLRDVRGVKRMFRREKQNESPNVSGVEELFDVSSRSEALFDQLLGKPPIRAKYSKSFVTTAAKRQNTRPNKSLHLAEVIENPEEWLERELQRRVHKDVDDKSHNESKSVNKELQKLATATVEGEAPVMTSRSRNSTMMKSVLSEREGESRRSAAENYSAHTLPIKKRSLINSTIDRSKKDSFNKSLKLGASVSRVELSLERSAARLPLKKRVLVHSTPVKGRGLAPGAGRGAGLGRDSPIGAGDSRPSLMPTPASPKTKEKKSRRVTNNVTVEHSSMVEVKPSPKKTRASKQAAGGKNTRKYTGGDAQVTNTKKRRTSLIITKKPPIISPKPPTPKATRSKRNTQPAAEIKVVKKPTRKNAQSVETNNVSEIVVKRATRGKKVNSSDVISPKKKVTREKKVKAEEVPNPKYSARAKNNKTVEVKVSPKKKTTRQKKVLEETKTPTPKKPRAKNNKSGEDKKSPKKKVEVKPKSPKRTRAKAQGTLIVSRPSPKLKPAVKDNKQTSVATTVASKSKDNKKVADKLKASPKTTRKTATKVAQQSSLKKSPVKTPVKRTRKQTEPSVKASDKKAKTPAKRGRQDKQVKIETTEKPKRGGRTEEKKAPSAVKAKRSTAKVATPEAASSRAGAARRGAEAGRQPGAGAEAGPQPRAGGEAGPPLKRKALVAAGSHDTPGKRGRRAASTGPEPAPGGRGTRGRKVPVEEAPKTAGRKRKAAVSPKEAAKKEPAAKKTRGAAAADKNPTTTRARRR